MSRIKPFRALRPRRDIAAQVAGPPYDVLSSDEARELAKDNPFSFLYVNKPEISLDSSVDIYDPAVYRQAGLNLQKLRNDGVLIQDEEAHFYVYKQIMGQHEQVGLVACASVDEYDQDRIKKHEFTRPDKEDDRVRHMDHLNAQVGPVFLTYKSRPSIDALVQQVMESQPESDFESDGIRHTFWVIRSAEINAALQREFAEVEALYVADGHHRSAAAQRIRDMRREANPAHTGEEPYNYFLTVIFPDNQMQILDYNRLVRDLNGHSKPDFLQAIERHFQVEKVADNQAAKPVRAHDFAMYLDAQWYRLSVLPGQFDASDPVGHLDVTILQNLVLDPLLGIADPRKDKRIDFVGGIRGLGELQRRVNKGDCAVAFALFPTSIGDLMAIADAGEVMPPKSTWFEPKLKSGLASHLLD